MDLRRRIARALREAERAAQFSRAKIPAIAALAAWAPATRRTLRSRDFGLVYFFAAMVGIAAVFALALAR